MAGAAEPRLRPVILLPGRLPGGGRLAQEAPHKPRAGFQSTGRHEGVEAA